MIKFKVKTTENLLKALSRETQLPFSVLNKKLREKQVLINNVRTGENILVSTGDEVVIFAKAAQSQINKVYEDENVLILIKPKGIETASKTERSFEADVQKQFKEAKAMHRLDRNTEGLVIFAKNKTAQEEFLAAFKNNEIIKIYIAQVFGRPKKNEKVTAYLKKNASAATVMIFNKKVKESEEILTSYKFLCKNGEISTLEVTLEKGGKTHQIRAHLSSLGLPLVGDGKYGNSELNKKYKQKTQELYATKIIFKLSGNLKYLNDLVIEYKPKLNF